MSFHKTPQIVSKPAGALINNTPRAPLRRVDPLIDRFLLFYQSFRQTFLGSSSVTAARLFSLPHCSLPLKQHRRDRPWIGAASLLGEVFREIARGRVSKGKGAELWLLLLHRGILQNGGGTMI